MVVFHPPKTWRNSGVKTTDLNREVRDQIRALQKQILVLQTSSSAGTVSAGTIVASVSTTVPTGYLLCDGRTTIDKATYPNLWNAIGVAYGAATTNTFTIPDFRNKFPRGNAALGAGLISGRGNASGSDSTNVTETTTVTNTVNANSDGAHYHNVPQSHTHNGTAAHNFVSDTVYHAHNTNSHGHGTGGSSANGNRGTGNSLRAFSGHTHSTNTGSVGVTNNPGESQNINYNENFNSYSSNVNSNTTNTDGAHTHSFSDTMDYTHSHTSDTLPMYAGISYFIKT